MKIKHLYRVHHFLESYPTEEDALFDICVFLENLGKLDEEWSDLGIKQSFSKKLTEREINALLKSLVDQNYLSFRPGAGKRNYYKIIKHDFGNTFRLNAIKSEEEKTT